LRLESARAKADRLVAEELRRLGWSEEDLVRRAKNDAGKLAIAVRLHRAMKDGCASPNGAQEIGK